MGRNSWTAFVVLTMFLLMSSASGQGGADMDMSAFPNSDDKRQQTTCFALEQVVVNAIGQADPLLRSWLWRANDAVP